MVGKLLQYASGIGGVGESFLGYCFGFPKNSTGFCNGNWNMSIRSVATVEETIQCSQDTFRDSQQKKSEIILKRVAFPLDVFESKIIQCIYLVRAFALVEFIAICIVIGML